LRCQKWWSFCKVDEFVLDLAVVILVVDRNDELNFGDLNEGMTVPSVGLKCLLHEVLEALLFYSLPEVSKTICRSVG
jgi:hypothetical protein